MATLTIHDPRDLIASGAMQVRIERQQLQQGPQIDAQAVSALVGIPYLERGRTRAGADCWGICYLAAHELFGLDVPEYFFAEQDILAHACTLIGQEVRGPHWHGLGVPPFPPGAVHIFRIRGFEVHCGIHLQGGDFLHSLPGRNSCVERLDDWAQRRTGSYAWTT